MTDENSDIKKEVRRKYAELARGGTNDESSCCGPADCGGSGSVVNMSPGYGDRERAAVPEGADLGLGCGTPTAFADISPGMTVLDLGSGAGVDCFIASTYVGESGHVIGVDMTQAMIDKAEENKAKVGVRNVEFRLGEIESLPVDDRAVDRVISNCVINLVPDKARAFGEIYRVLRPGGKFIVSDIVVDGKISDAERKDASLWAGCISGALERKEYLQTIERAGFHDVQIVSEKKYDYVLTGGAGLYSVTISASR